MQGHPFHVIDRVAIITGAGKGIGRETAKVFKQAGAKLALISRTESDLVSLQSELGMAPSDIHWEAGDVSDAETVKGFVARCHGKFGRIDVLINNAGMRFRKPFLEITHDEWQQVMDVNVGSTFLFCQEAGRHMVAQGRGSIVNMASVVGTLALPDLAGYAASKGAIISLTKSLSVEWAKNSVNVNVVAPGFCKTSYTDNFKKKTELYQMTLDRTPQGRWGSSADIANACLFLASDASSYVTGEVMNVDGGWSAW